jgi:glycosyltransferase involved in cell wall biosynthesis
VRVAIAHDWIAVHGGSERCVEELKRAFPGARLLTAVCNTRVQTDELANAEPSFLQRVPGAATHHEYFLPMMPLAWRCRRALSDVDVVIASSHACAHAVRAANGIPLVVYCHTPMRYAWDFESERYRFHPLARPVARSLMAAFRHWDVHTAGRVDRFIANSTAVARRIRRAYGREADVIHPPVRTDFFTPGDQKGDFFLYVGRLTGYKRPDIVVEAFSRLRENLVVVGTGPMASRLKEQATPNVSFVGNVEDEQLRDLYRRAQALVYPANEDFGIAMAEAQACGTPVVGLARGGALDIVDRDELGVLVRRQDPRSFATAVAAVRGTVFDPLVISRAAARFSAMRFREQILATVTAEVLQSEQPSRPSKPAARKTNAPASWEIGS